MKSRCPSCGKNGGHTRTGNYWRCRKCSGLFDTRDDGEVYTDPTKRARLHESGHHDRVAREQGLKGGL